MVNVTSLAGFKSLILIRTPSLPICTDLQPPDRTTAYRQDELTNAKSMLMEQFADVEHLLPVPVS